MILTLVLLGVAHYLVYKKSRTENAEKSKVILRVSTVVALTMILYSLKNGGQHAARHRCSVPLDTHPHEEGHQGERPGLKARAWSTIEASDERYEKAAGA